MKRIFILVAVSLLPFTTASTQAEAGPSWQGTAFYTLSPGVTTSVDWSVYAPGDTGSLSGLTTNYTYQYTLNGVTGLTSSASFTLGNNISAPTPIFASGKAKTIGSSSVATVGIAPNSGFLRSTNNAFLQTINLKTGDGAIAWWNVAAAPTGGSNSRITIGGNNIFSTDIIATPGPLGSSIAAFSTAPGAPEPATWALLLTMMAFTTVWMRRKQDDEPLETAVIA